MMGMNGFFIGLYTVNDFSISQVAWPETFKLCYDGISVWICPPKFSDLKLWRMAKIHSWWTDQYRLAKYCIHHSIIAFRVDYCFTTLWVPIVLVSYMEWDPIVTGTLTQWHAHNDKPDDVQNKVVSKQINMIKSWDEWPRQRSVQCEWFFEFLKLHGLKPLSCAMMEYQFEFAHQSWVTWSYGRWPNSIRAGLTSTTYQNIGSITQILPSRVDFWFTT